MTSKRLQVLQAVRALVEEALPDAVVTGFDGEASLPGEPEAGGTATGFPGDPGKPEIDLSPLTWHYQHEIPIELTPPLDSEDPASAIDAMQAAIATAIESDRTLGGLANWVEPTAPTEEEYRPDGASPLRVSSFSITVHYATPSPL